MQPDGKPPQADSFSRAQVASLLGLLLVILLGVIAPICLWIWQAHAPSAALRSMDVGTFISADSSQGGFFAPTLTNVHTTGGSITVIGTFSALRGRPLSVQDHNKSGVQLCVTDAPASCAPLAGAWTGGLEPTSQAARVFDFYKYGLTSENFVGWLTIGCVLSFAAFVLFGVAFGDPEQMGKHNDIESH